MNQPIRILIVDDHPVVRVGIQGMFVGHRDFEVVGEASSGEQVITLVEQLNPDVILMDLRMPGLGGVETTRRICDAHPNVRVLILTTFDSDQDIKAALNAGAAGYLLKDTPREDLFQAVWATAQGRRVLAPAVTERLLDQLYAPDESLTEREIAVLTLAAHGETNKNIGKQLHISEATVKTHLKHIYTKLGVSDRAAAVALALDRELIRLKPH